jgi:hypothetical protein
VLVDPHGGNVAESFDARDRSGVASKQLVRLGDEPTGRCAS